MLAAGFAAISFWHVFYSRMGLRGIPVVPFRSWSFGFCGAPLHERSYKTMGWRVWRWPGLVYVSYHALAAARGSGDCGYDDARRRALNGNSSSRVTPILFGVCAVLIAPLAPYFAAHPDEFLSHTVQVSVLSSDAEQPDLVGAIWSNTLRVLGMFFVVGDQGLVRNLPGRPIFDPIVGALFLVGVGFMLFTLFRPRLPSFATVCLRLCWASGSRWRCSLPS